ncbi:MAG TPA: serine/threonine-protein kinase [Burkholderiales bacterium]|nr:serine/threonine-protein kinase [Burkholderiales bacterium]
MKFELEWRIGKYPITQEIGRGATSRVYLGRDPFADRDVAIKVFFFEESVSEQTAKLLRKGFLAEAALAGRLNHPHICAIYDAVSEPEYSYIVMEYVKGTTLETYAEIDSLLPLSKLVEVIFKCIRALDFAFQLGVIHRDIKPGNILYGPEGDIKVSDFGASFQEALAQDTTQLTGIGSPAYMSPEQIRLEEVTHRTDIYSLGVVMYKLLTGRLPFNASNQLSLTYEILNVVPPPPSQLRPELPELLDEICLKAMQKNPADRYATWIDFGKDLSKAFTALRLAGETISDSAKFNELRTLVFFEDFDDVTLWEALRISTWRTIPGKTMIIREGDSGESFYLLVEGQVDVSIQGKSINVVRRGGCFGELLYFSDQVAQRTTTITSTTDITVVEIKTIALKVASSACQVSFQKAFMRVLIERLTQTNAKLAAR